jgi:hypothetical protein
MLYNNPNNTSDATNSIREEQSRIANNYPWSRRMIMRYISDDQRQRIHDGWLNFSPYNRNSDTESSDEECVEDPEVPEEDFATPELLSFFENIPDHQRDSHLEAFESTQTSAVNIVFSTKFTEEYLPFTFKELLRLLTHYANPDSVASGDNRYSSLSDSDKIALYERIRKETREYAETNNVMMGECSHLEALRNTFNHYWGRRHRCPVMSFLLLKTIRIINDILENSE